MNEVRRAAGEEPLPGQFVEGRVVSVEEINDFIFENGMVPYFPPWKWVGKRSGVKWLDVEDVPVDYDLDPPNKHCMNCWYPGHQRKYCPYPRTFHCFNCGRRGVSEWDCPRCRYACYRATGEGPDPEIRFPRRPRCEAPDQLPNRVQEERLELALIDGPFVSEAAAPPDKTMSGWWGSV